MSPKEPAERSLWPDVAAAVGLAVVLVPLSAATVSTRLSDRALGSDAEQVTVALLALLLILPLAGRRRWPTASAAAVFAVGLVQLALGVWWIPADIAVLVALYSITVWGAGRGHLVALAVVLVGGLVCATYLVLAESRGGGSFASWVLVSALILSAAVASWAFGWARRVRREQVEDLRDRAERLERDRDQQSALAVGAERARIAREMHDVVAHSLSVIIAQADGGRYASASDPAAGVRALAVIAETGRAALTDMRAILGVLRAGSAADAPAGEGGSVGGGRVDGGLVNGGLVNGTSGAASLAPQPVVGDVESLVNQLREAGMSISLVRLGTARTLPAGVGLTLYRICQEALTNVLKHAGPAPSVMVLLRWRDDAVQLEVTDDGRGASAVGDGAGQGLVGMRERAAMFGGTISAAPRAGGGFQVKLVLPTPRTARLTLVGDPSTEAVAAPAFGDAS